MHLGALLSNFQLEKVRLGPAWANVEISFDQSDQDAAWELYVEMLLRVVTQPLPSEGGDESTALKSIYTLFPVTREILRRRGRSAISFSKVAIPIMKPSSSSFYHEVASSILDRSSRRPGERAEFRKDLEGIQSDLRNYNRLLAQIAG